MDATYSLASRGGVQILRVRDLISEVDNQEIMKAVEARIAAGFTNFVVDLSPVEYMNSVGINFLIKMKHRAGDSGGRLVVAHASGKVKQLLDITKLRPLFNLSDSIDDAVQSIAAYDQ